MIKKKNDILNNIKAVYFIGTGGIGMSALAEYFIRQGIYTAGYDKTPSVITDNLQKNGAEIHFDDDINLIPEKILNENKENVLIVYTPAVPDNHTELTYFKTNNYNVFKRSAILGYITGNSEKLIAVAGTHGKTSVSTIVAHIFKSAGKDITAFLGGISKNYNSNLIFSGKKVTSEFAVSEADEYDRSFLKLFPHTALITAIDADHLDIYKDINDIRETFEKFVNQIDKKGNLLIKANLKINDNVKPENVYTYSVNEKADYFVNNIREKTNLSTFDLHCPKGVIKDVILSVPGRLNIENALAAAAIADIYGISHNNVKKALKSWTGVKRRFDFHINTPGLVYIDDYAHHPEELRTFINSVKKIYPEKKLICIFQPHLYSRTRDFASEFAESLSLCDKVILTDIYPAREKPIPGITSEIIFKEISIKEKILCKKEDIIQHLDIKKNVVYMTTGAGDIDGYVEKIKKHLSENE